MVNLERASQIKGWMSQIELEWLAHTAKKCQYIIEVGSYYGRSTRALADNTDGTVIVVDPYSGDYYNNDGSVMMDIGTDVMQKFNENLADHIATRKVVHFRTNLAICPIITSDLIFLDGDHRRLPVESDISQAFRRLRKNGILAGHDYGRPDWPGVKQAVDGMLGKVEVIDTIWYKQL